MIVGIIVALITILLHNLALAVLSGVVISALVFAWESAVRIRVRKSTDENGYKVYEIYGPLFFGSVNAFLDKFDIDTDPEQVIIDFKESRVADMSAIEALNKLSEKYGEQHKHIVLRYLSPDCRRLLRHANSTVEISPDDPAYHVMPE